MHAKKLLLRHHVLTVAVLLFVVGCAAPTRTAAPGPTGGTETRSSTAQEMQIAIQGFAFSPREVTVPVGTKVTWTMRDSGTTHTVTVAAKTSEVTFDQSMKTGETFSYTFNKAGVFEYFCAFHPSIRGTISVGDAKPSDLPQQPAQSTPADPYYQSGY